MGSPSRIIIPEPDPMSTPAESPPAPEHVLAAIAAARTASIAVQALADRMALQSTDLASPLARLIRSGLVERWPGGPDGPALALTPLAAGRLGIELDAGSERWVKAGTTPRHRPAPEADPEEEHQPVVEWFADRRALEPLDELIAAEAVEQAAASYAPRPPQARPGQGRWASARDDEESHRLPRPRTLLGLGVPWPVPPEPDGRCPVCLDRRLRTAEYCLICDRGGIDRLIAPAEPARPRAVHQPGPLRGGKGGTLSPRPRRRAS